MKKRIFSLTLALVMCLGLLPAMALAAEGEQSPLCDVYQGDGFYITARPYTLKSTRYTIGNSHNYNFDGRFHDGMIAVWTDNVDENYVNRQFVQEYNFADKDGNILFPEGLFHGDYYIYSEHEGDMAPSEGMIPFWDGETKGGSNSNPLLGFVDYSGREVIGCQYLYDTITPFREGLSSAGVSGEREGFIDKSGREVISAANLHSIYVGSDAFFSDGLVPCRCYGVGVTTYGYMDTSGNLALKLLSYSNDDAREYDNDYWKMYADGKTDGYLKPVWSAFNECYFSDGYAVCYDLRSGNELDYNFAIIDKSGNVVGTFSDAEPYGSGFHDGLLRVQFIDNRNNSAGCGFVNTKGEVVIRESDCANPTVGWAAGGNTNKGYSCGLLVVRERIVADTKGNTVIPEGAFESMRPFDSDIAIGFLSPECGGVRSEGIGTLHTPYVFEKHEGTYSGSGTVYDSRTGGVQTPAQPETPVTPPAAVGGFTDVAETSPFKDAILWAVDQGITNGTSGTTFSPSDTCTVRQILTFLYRAAGKPGAVSGQNDLDAAVSWATAEGILPQGADSTAACTRSMAVEFMWKAAGSPEPTQSAAFDDVSADAAYASAVAWAVEKGVTNGTGGNNFSPENTCTRGQIVTFLYRNK